MKPHAFVAMPFGSKPDKNGNLVDFNRVYSEYIKPALERANLEAFRADEEQRAGDIRTDMFQELLIADLVVVDISIDNPNVWYELGVRHALRARGVVLVCGGKPTPAFDIYTDRKLRYGVANGGPDPESLEADVENLARMINETMESWHGRKISPVYSLMPNLQEPDWKSLRIGDVREFWELYDRWEDLVAEARRNMHLGDILLLGDEAPVAVFRADAWIRAGSALRRANHFDFALEFLERGLAVQPEHWEGLQEKGICLQRLAEAETLYSIDRARIHYKDALKIYPEEAEIWALLGRVDKDAWVKAWRIKGTTKEEMREEAKYEDARLRNAIESYYSGFRIDPSHYYSGINALVLMYFYQDLTDDDRYKSDLDILEGAVRFAAFCATDDSHQKYWASTTLGDIEVLSGNPESVKSAYKEAIAKHDKNWFDLDSPRQQLTLMQDIGFKPENVSAGIETFDRAMKKLTKPGDSRQPRKVVLFSGHMVDAPNRETPRFPVEKLGAAQDRLDKILEKLDLGSEDLALTQGACGGDLLFSESCQKRGVEVRWYQPFDEPKFIQESVVRGGEEWRSRYYAAKEKLKTGPISAPRRLGDPPRNMDEFYPYERCNLWLLYTTLSYGLEKVHFICIWDGQGGDGPGGTAHMYEEVKKRTGRVYQVNPMEI